MKIPALLLLTSSLALAQVSVLTYHNNAFRTGLNPKETVLTYANVNSTSFGKLFVLAADGKVDAQPLYVPALSIGGSSHNVVYVATEHDSVYAYDADNGTQLWKVSLLGSGESTSDDRGCSQVVPEIGITATPAIDPTVGTHGTIFVVAMTKDSSGGYHHRLHALDLTTGAEQFSGPVEVQATYPGTGDESSNGTVTFNPAQHKERAGLLITGGKVVTTWSSHCDFRPYTGWIISYNETTLTRASVLNVTPNGNEGAIWMTGDGPAADRQGNIYFLDANGSFDTSLNSSGAPTKSDYGQAVIKLSNTGGQLAVSDYFEMWNGPSESNSDSDLGSGGVMLLPDLQDSTGTERHLVVGAGKDENIYVMDRDNLGKYNSTDNNVFQQWQNLNGSVFSSPAFFVRNLYYGASGDKIREFTFKNGLFTTTPVAQTTTTFAYPGATPSISANGTGNAIVWATENNSTAVLHAYKALSLAELYNSSQAGSRDNFGSGNKFIAPMIANGKVYVGTQTGVGVFGLLNPGSSAKR